MAHSTGKSHKTYSSVYADIRYLSPHTSSPSTLVGRSFYVKGDRVGWMENMRQLTTFCSQPIVSHYRSNWWGWWWVSHDKWFDFNWAMYCLQCSRTSFSWSSQPNNFSISFWSFLDLRIMQKVFRPNSTPHKQQKNTLVALQNTKSKQTSEPIFFYNFFLLFSTVIKLEKAYIITILPCWKDSTIPDNGVKSLIDI